MRRQHFHVADDEIVRFRMSRNAAAECQPQWRNRAGVASRPDQRCQCDEHAVDILRIRLDKLETDVSHQIESGVQLPIFERSCPSAASPACACACVNRAVDSVTTGNSVAIGSARGKPSSASTTVGR